MGRIEVRAGILPTVLLGIIAVLLLPAVVMVPPGAAAVFGLMAVGCVVGAIALGMRRLWVDDEGVTTKGMFGTRHIAWNEVDYYTFWSMNQEVNAAAGAAGGLLGIAIASIVIAIVNSRQRGDTLNRQFSTGRLKIVARDRRASIAIDARYRHLEPVLDRAFHELHDRLRAGHRRDYNPFTVSDHALVHRRKGTLALAEIEKISVGGARLIVKKRDKRLAWARIHMGQLTNGLLFLEDLAERGVSVSTSAGTFVPPSILQKILAAASRQAALPAARVVKH